MCTVIYLVVPVFLLFAATAHRPGFVVRGKWIVEKTVSSPPTLAAFLIAEAPHLFATSTAAKKAVRRGLVYVDGQQAAAGDHLITPGEIITTIVRVEPATPSQSHSQSQSPDDLRRHGFILPVAYEDDCCAVVVKPQGISVLRSSGDNAQDCTTCNNVQSALPHSLRLTPTTTTINVLRRPQPVHRLDKGTGGLLLVAKTKEALVALSQQFERHAVKKRYLALTVSDPSFPPPSGGTIDTPLGGQAALTMFAIASPPADTGADVRTVVRRHIDDGDDDPFGDLAVSASDALNTPFGTVRCVEVRIFTGRTHQIRRHLDMVGMPVLGDPRYYFSRGGQCPVGSTLSQSALPRCVDRGMFLFSTGLSFVHPVDGDRVTVTLPEPVTFRRLRGEFDCSHLVKGNAITIC